MSKAEEFLQEKSVQDNQVSDNSEGAFFISDLLEAYHQSRVNAIIKDYEKEKHNYNQEYQIWFEDVFKKLLKQ